MLTHIMNAGVLRPYVCLTCSSDGWTLICRVWFVWTELCTIMKAFIRSHHLRINKQHHIKSSTTSVLIKLLLYYELYRSAG